MAETATAPAAQEQKDLNKSLLAALAGDQHVQYQHAGGDQPMPPSNGMAEGADVKQAQQPTAPTTTVPAAATTETPAAPSTPPDPFAEALTGEKQNLEWAPDAKELFKKTFGAEDPLAYKTEVEQRLAELNEVKQRVVTGDNLAANLKKLEQESPILYAAILEQLEGRDALTFISKQPNLTIAGKKAADVPDATLMDAYVRERFSDDEREALRTGKYDELGISESELKAKVKLLRPAAEFMHEQRETERNKSIQSREQQIIQTRERDTQSRAAAIAHAQSDRFARIHLTQEAIEAFRNNSIFTGVLYDQDGMFHANSLTATLKAKHYDGDVLKAKEIGEKIGYELGFQAATAQLPSPRPGQRLITATEQATVDQNMAIISQALKG